MPNHYETLGLQPSASEREIKTAYRQIVLKHHPDVSKSTDSKAIFRAASDAYEVLVNETSRREYDRRLAHLEEVRLRQQREAQREGQVSAQKRVTTDPDEAERRRAELADLLQRMTVSFSRGQSATAEKLAVEVLSYSMRQPVAHAILGDIARAKGDLNEAARRYAYAAQFDPANTVYQKRYEELLMSTTVVSNRHEDYLVGPPTSRKAIAGAGAVMLVFAVMSALVQGEVPVLLWSIAYGIGAVSMGVGLSVGNWLDRLGSVVRSAAGGLGIGAVVVALMTLNVWLGLAVFGGLFLFQRAQIRSLTITSVVVTLMSILFGMTGAISGSLDWAMATFVLTVPGGLSYFAGWAIGDALRALAESHE